MNWSTHCLKRKILLSPSVLPSFPCLAQQLLVLSLESEGELAAFSATAVTELASYHCLPPQHTAFLLSARSLGGWELPEGGGLLLKPLLLEACTVYRQEGCIFSFTGLHIYQPWDLLWQHWFESLCCVLVLSWKREVRKVWRTAERGSSPTLERWLSSQSVACWRRSDSSWCCCWLGKNLLHQQHLSLLPGSQAVELPALVIQTAPAGFSRSWGQVRLCCLMCPHTVWYPRGSCKEN